MANFTAGAVLTASALNSAFNTATINAQTTGYTIGTADAGNLVTVNNNSGGTVTIPANSTWGAATGTIVSVLNAGTAGSWTIGTAAGVTLNASSTSLAPLESGRLVKTATNTWYFTKGGDSTSQGLYLITPSSIANSGGSASASGGAVTFSGVTSVSLNGVFTSTYDAYRIVMRLTGTSDNTLTFRLRVSGSDASGTDYQYETFTASNTTLAGARATSQTSAVIGYQNSTGASHHMELTGPALAEFTTFVNQNSYNGSATLSLSSGLHGLSTAYDGITFFATAGNITGKVRCYGLKN